MALLITADSDFVPAIQAAKRIKNDLRIVVAFPPKRHSDDLKRSSDAYFTIGQNVIRRSQLPARVPISEGVILERPRYWR